MGLGRVEDAWIKCLRQGRFVKLSSKWERCIVGIYGFGNAYDMIDRRGMWETKIVWS